MKKCSLTNIHFNMTEKILSAFHVLYHKVKSVVMAKQTVINFLKTCINIYIVLPDPVLRNQKLDPMKLGRHGMSFALWGFKSREITLIFFSSSIYVFVFFFLFRIANSSTDNFETHDGKYCTPGCPTLSTLVRIQKVTLMFFFFSLFLSFSFFRLLSVLGPLFVCLFFFRIGT